MFIYINIRPKTINFIAFNQENIVDPCYNSLTLIGQQTLGRSVGGT